MSTVWGTYLRDFREQTGLSQGEFSDAMSLLWLQLSDEERERLNQIGVDHLDLGRSDVSRYENGHRQPRNRSRYVALIYALYKLNGVQTSDEASEWLRKADQGPLTTEELSTIFGADAVNSDVTSTDLSNTDTPESKQVESKQVETSTSPKQETGIEADAPQSESPPPSGGIGYPPDTVPRLSGLLRELLEPLKESYSLGAIFLLILIGLIAGRLLQISPFPSSSVPTVEPPSEQSETPAVFITPSTDSDSEAIVIPNTPPAPSTDAASDLGVVMALDFETGRDDGWVYTNTDRAEQIVSVEEGALCSEILLAGIAPWDLAMRYKDFPLKANTIYQLAFDVSVAADRNLSIGIRENDGHHFYSTQLLKTGTQSVEMELRQHIDDDDAALLLWPGGQTDGQLCIDNIVLSAVDTFVPSLDSREGRAAVPENLIPSATFDERYIKNWWFSQANGAAYEVTFHAGSLCATVRHPGNDIHDLTLGQSGIELAIEKNHRLVFDVFSSNIDTLQIYIEGFTETIELPPDWSEVEVEFVSLFEPTEGNPDGTLMLQFGGQPDGTLCIDNLLLVKAPESES